jgi:prepilin-type N-terminal cleavage/methylation domain-containing protein
MDSKKGFTLVELMIVAGIMCIIGLAITSTFAGGLKVYYKMRSYSTVKADVLLALERIEKDIRNAFAFADMDFVGTSRKVTFPALVRSYDADDIPYMSVGSAAYFTSERSKKRQIAREEKNYSISSMKAEGSKGVVADIAAVDSMSFEYYSYDPLSDAYVWKDSWDKREEKEKEKENPPKKPILLKDRREDIPLGVKVTLGYSDGEKKFTVNRAIFIEPAVSLSLAKAALPKKDGE